MNYINLLTVLFFTVFTFHSSYSQKDIRKADKQLELRAYDLAIKNYKAYLDQNPNNELLKEQLRLDNSKDLTR